MNVALFQAASGGFQRPRSMLHKYQSELVEWLKAAPARGLFLDVGTGKSAIMLHAIADLKAASVLDGPAVVLTTPRIAVSVWPREAALWAETAALRVVPVIGTPTEREAAVKAGADVYVVSIHSLKSFMVDWGKHCREPIGVLVVDESTLIKNPNSARTRDAMKIAAKAGRRWIATATPRANRASELFAQIRHLDAGVWGSSFFLWRHRFMMPVDAWNWTLKPGAEKRIAANLKPLVVSLKARDMIELPPRIDIEAPFSLGPAGRAAYDDMASDFILRFSDTDAMARNGGALAAKLAQLTGGYVYGDDSKARWIHGDKVETVKELIGQAGEPVLLWSWYRPMQERLLAEFPKALELGGDPRKVDRAVDAWNSGKVELLLGTPASAAHGLNLAAGGAVMIWAELPRSAELLLQAQGRLDRQGQWRPVRQYFVLGENTIDETILDILRRRIAGQDAMRDAWGFVVATVKAKAAGVDLMGLKVWAAEAHPDRGGTDAEFRRRWTIFEAERKRFVG